MSALSSLQVDSAVSYLIAFLFPALDAVFPVLPSESAVIALGVVTAGSADPRIGLLVACAAAGAFAGDNLSYLLGHRFGPAVQRRFFTTPKGVKARAWAERSLARYGPQLIIVCRFIPGGRTAVTLTCGLTGYPRRRFVPATALAAVIWALYAFFIGRLGGRAFEDNPWAGLVIAFAASIALSVLVEVIRRLWRRWHGTNEHGTDEHGADEHGADEHGADEHGKNELQNDEHGDRDRAAEPGAAEAAGDGASRSRADEPRRAEAAGDSVSRPRSG